jgi:formiminoglutamase
MKKSRNEHFCFSQSSSDLMLNYTNARVGEKRIGEVLNCDWRNENVHYVILGVSESIGPQSNFGRAGAEKAFEAFLGTFCNMQLSSSIQPNTFAILGEIKCLAGFPGIDSSREWVSELDDFIFETLFTVVESGKIPIVIGGGHNNAYSLIKLLNTRSKEVAVVNMDAHADCRKLEGRHSGNSFSYAVEEGLLKKYSVFGLHRAFNNQEMIQYLVDRNISHQFFEDYVFRNENFEQSVQNYLKELNNHFLVGVELDLDCIENMPSSAMSPIGFTISEARNYLRICSDYQNVGYYHLTEGAIINLGDERIVGKVLAQFVFDILTKKY